MLVGLPVGAACFRPFHRISIVLWSGFLFWCWKNILTSAYNNAGSISHLCPSALHIVLVLISFVAIRTTEQIHFSHLLGSENLFQTPERFPSFVVLFGHLRTQQLPKQLVRDFVEGAFKICFQSRGGVGAWSACAHHGLCTLTWWALII